jgi:hypothetical protein
MVASPCWLPDRRHACWRWLLGREAAILFSISVARKQDQGLTVIWRRRIGDELADDEFAGQAQGSGATVIIAARSEGRSFQ